MTGELFALLAAAFWSLHMIFAKKAQVKNAQSANPLDPMVGVFVTILVNNVINFFVLTVRYAFWDPVPVAAAGVIALSIGGAFNSFVGRGLLFASISILGAARTGLTRAVMPVFVLLGGVLVLGERFSPQAWIGIGIVLFGLFLMSFDTLRKDSKKLSESAQPDTAKDRAGRSRIIKGIVFGLGAAMIMASGNILRKAGVDALPDTILAVSVGSFAALFVCVAVLLIARKGRAMLAAIKKIDFYYVMAGAAASAALYSMVYSLRLIPVAITNSIVSTESLFTILFLWLMKEGKKEKMGIETLFFGVIMVIGTILLVTSGAN